MESWILAAIAGWCPTGWPRWHPWWWPRWWPIPPLPVPPEPDPPPDWGPIPDPWQPMLNGVLGAIGGLVAWAVLRSEFADAGWAATAGIGFLGGCVGLSVAGTIHGLRSRAGSMKAGQR